jgi:hypothetical protein
VESSAMEEEKGEKISGFWEFFFNKKQAKKTADHHR